ncbi:DNA methyltransferase [bacterium]|nr:DNA methyltransferase [bacterium]
MSNLLFHFSPLPHCYYRTTTAPKVRIQMLSKDVTLHHLKKTAARDTDDYVFSQLIPYIGNKRKLLDIIHQAINMTEVDGGSFVDLFSGSTVVARFAKKLGFRVLANDWEPYSEQIAIGTIVNNKEPPFLQLGGCENVFRMLNDVKPIEGYITKHLCPEDDQNLNHEEDRLFFMRKNGMKIDAMRELISSWTNDEKISSEEFGYLMASLAYSVSYVSNTSGVFKGFHRGWGGSNGTAQYRICSDIELRPAILFDNGEKNISTREDAGKLVLELTNILGEIPDIIYLDPPYNQHPYGSNYHVLNTVTLWDKPDFPKKITRGTKSAIRLDWRTDRRSAYNSQRRAAQEFQELIDNITAKFILTSYSTEGNIPLEEMMRILGSKGSLRIVKREYVRYRVSPTRLSPKPRNVEFVVITDTNGKPESIESLEEIVSELHRIDSEIQIIQS